MPRLSNRGIKCSKQYQKTEVQFPHNNVLHTKSKVTAEMELFPHPKHRHFHACHRPVPPWVSFLHLTPSHSTLPPQTQTQHQKMSSLSPSPHPQTWLIVGASRGIGLEYARQLLVLNHRVLATARTPSSASHLLALAASPNGDNLTILECDVADEESIFRLRDAVELVGLSKIDVCVLNAGILVYPNRISELLVSAPPQPFSKTLLMTEIDCSRPLLLIYILIPLGHWSALRLSWGWRREG